MCGDDTKVKMLKSCAKFIVAEIDHNDGKGIWTVVGVYWDPGRSLNPEISAKLEQFTSDSDSPVLVVWRRSEG